MQEREFPTVLPATYLTTGHLRQHPLHIFAVQRSATWTDVVGVLDAVWAGDPDPVALLTARQDFDAVSYVVIPQVEDAVQLMEWAAGPFSKSVNALCHSGNSREQLMRVVCALVDFIPLLEPIAPPMEVSANDPIFHDQTLGREVIRSSGYCRIVKCRVPLQRNAGLDASPVQAGQPQPTSDAAGVSYREPFSAQALALRARVEAEVVQLETVRRAAASVPQPPTQRQDNLSSHTGTL
jgi:hypothetical protein